MLQAFALAMAEALLGTLAVEVPLSLVFLVRRDLASLGVVALAQLMTNPLVEVACLALGWYPDLPLVDMRWWAMIAVELVAVAAEGMAYRATGISRHPWAMSVVLNVASFGLGLLM